MDERDPGNLEVTEKAKVLRRLSRRRRRRTKVGANPGTTERSWAEYSGVTLTPSSDHSLWQRLFMPVLFTRLLIVAIAALVFGDHQSTEWGEDAGIWSAVIGYSLIGLIALCIVSSVVKDNRRN